jgi:20S proteasome alpha/beta subunit
MTIVMAYRTWKSVAVIADCRVSYNPPYEDVDDYLQKLYQIGTRLVIGFAGPLQGAYQIMELVRANARSYSKPPVAENLLSTHFR